MFVRKKVNSSGSTSVQIIVKNRGRYKVVKTIGCSSNEQELQKFLYLGKQEIERLEAQSGLFVSEKDTVIEQVFSSIGNSSIRTVGPELIFGKIYDSIGFRVLEEKLFRHLVIARLAFPLSKLKTIEYLYRFQGVMLDLDTVYRFLDKLNSKLKERVEQIAFAHTLNVLQGNVSIVFYDMTTLYFEASDEDDLRKTGFSKDGKHQNPQIFIGLLVGLGGYAIGYDIFEGNIYEGHTLIPFIEKISEKFKLNKPVVVADAGLLSNENIKALEQKGYEYIIGARLKNEPDKVKKQILGIQFSEGQIIRINKAGRTRLIVSYATNRAAKDEHNRIRGLQRLEKRVKAGKLTKSSINNKGYNKYLRLQGDVTIEIDYEKFNQDKVWDGLKGYTTNTKLRDKQVIENYKNLWHIEKAFRMSKTDLRIRPIYHRLKHRIEAHICISFTAYCIYKELERLLYKEKSGLSLKKAAELTHNMYQITYILPESKQYKSQLLKMDDQQAELYKIILKNFPGVPQRKTGEQVTRLNAFFVIVTVVLAFIGKSPLFLIFLMADFYMRAFTKLKYSPISYLSSGLSNALQLPSKPIDKAPKIFAARLGFLMTSIICLLFILEFQVAAGIVAGILVFFATLEFAFAICIGCVIYTYLVLPFYKK